MRVHGTLGELLADADLAAILHAREHGGAGRHHVLAEVAFLVVNGQRLRVLVGADLQRAGDPVSYTHLDVYKRQALFNGG